MTSWRTCKNAGQRSDPPQICETLERAHSLGKSSGRLPAPPPFTGEREVASVVSPSGHCHLGHAIDTSWAHFSHVCPQSRAMMPKLFGQLRAFPFCGDKRTCRTKMHIHKILHTRWEAVRTQPANCKDCSRYIYLLSIDVLCGFWAIEMTQRMRSRRRFWPPTNICTNSGDSRRCPLG